MEKKKKTLQIFVSFTVSPPKNLVITDPGHLGQLEITWNPPDSLPNVTECSVRYQLEYNTYRESWAVSA